MRSLRQIFVFALGTVAVLIPTGATAQVSGVQVWTKRCGACHTQQPANRYTADQWESIVTHMELTARLTSAQADAVLDFLKSGARQVAMQEHARPTELMVASARGTYLPQTAGPGDLFRANCVPCHGSKGKGDGPAAVAFDPRPADLTDPDVVKNRSSEELVRIISTGGGGMPAFASLLSEQEIAALAEYIRSL